MLRRDTLHASVKPMLGKSDSGRVRDSVTKKPSSRKNSHVDLGNGGPTFKVGKNGAGINSPDDFRAAQAGDAAAKQRLFEQNYKLVQKVASQMVTVYLPYDDCVQVGSIALMRAIMGFDPARGFRFSTYAIKGIRRVISRWRLESNVVRIPCNNRMERRPAQSIDEPFKHPACFDPEIDGDEIATVPKLMEWLTERQQAVIRMRFWEEKTLDEVAGVFGLTRERIRQIETSALQIMRRRAVLGGHQ